MRKLVRRRAIGKPGSQGQALVEFALILPLFIMVLTGIIVIGIIVFYNQQLTNAAREAARFAAIHSASDPFCPVAGHLAPSSPPLGYQACDSVNASWPRMTAFARSKVFGVNPANVIISACWSGWEWNGGPDGPPPGDYAPPFGTVNSTWPDPPIPSVGGQCTIDGVDPTASASAIDCAPGLVTVDTASNISEAPGRPVANRVTAYACMEWSPPMAGFLLIPDTVTLRAVISEPIKRQN
jgi:hypothetical protein